MEKGYWVSQDTADVLSDLKQQGVNQKQLLAIWPLHPATPKKGLCVHVWPAIELQWLLQLYSHTGSRSAGLFTATLLSLLETLFLGKISGWPHLEVSYTNSHFPLGHSCWISIRLNTPRAKLLRLSLNLSLSSRTRFSLPHSVWTAPAPKYICPSLPPFSYLTLSESWQHHLTNPPGNVTIKPCKIDKAISAA